MKNENGTVNNISDLEGFIDNIIVKETGLINHGSACIVMRHLGSPVSNEDKKWQQELIRESWRKKKYQVVNQIWNQIPTRLTDCKMFNNSISIKL